MANQMEYEWIEHWQSLRGRSDPTVCYEAAIERVWKIEGESRTVASLLNHASRLLELLGLYSGALTYRERAFRILENNAVPNDPVLAPDIDNLASLHLAVGNIKKADELSQHALDAQQNPPDSEGAERAIYLGNRAMHLEQQGSPAEALPVAEQALRILKLVKGPDHSDVAIMLSNLSTIHFDLENLGEALRLQLRALEIEEHLKGPSHTDVGRCLHNLAFIYMAREEFAVAFACFSRSLAILEKALGHEHPDVAAVLSGIGLCHVSQGDYENARGFLEKALSMKRKLKGESHPDVAYTLYSLAGALAMLDEFRGAMEYCGRAVAIAQEVFGNQHPKTLMYRERLRAIEQCVVS
jgi:tetratricopeptide (TPR) repeat protein